MGELDEAIRDHLALKRRRGADPAEVAREEQEALAPVTRGHAVVVAEDLEPDRGEESSPAVDADQAPQHADSAESPKSEDPGDATQEFRVEHDSAADDWLEEGDA